MPINHLNQNSRSLLETARDELTCQTLKNGAEVFDFNSGCGVLLSKICLADLAAVKTCDGHVEVATDKPLLACMASQYAGWPLSVGDYFAMCSGPARATRGKEKVLEEYGLVAKSNSVVVVLETGRLPDESVAEAVATECNVSPDKVQLCVARTSSIAGTTQIVARSVETAMHKLHELEFDLTAIIRGIGSAPMPPVAKDDLTALGWTNDSILYGATVELDVDCEDEQLEQIGPKVPSSSSADFGTPFLEIFERFDRDFYKIDKMLFSPARVIFSNVRTGKRFQFGETRTDILQNSWGLNE